MSNQRSHWFLEKKENNCEGIVEEFNIKNFGEKKTVKKSKGEPGVTQISTGFIPRTQAIVWSSMAPLVNSRVNFWLKTNFADQMSMHWQDSMDL